MDWHGVGAGAPNEADTSNPSPVPNRKVRSHVLLTPVRASGHPLSTVPKRQMQVLTVSMSAAYQAVTDFLHLLVAISPVQDFARTVSYSSVD